MKTALVIGGTAATGVAIVAGLRKLGYQVTIYHRGTHELPELMDLEHIHGDPHHRSSIMRDIGGRSWDVVVATYGRVRYLAEALAGHTGHFVSISGMPVVGAQIGVPTTEATARENPENAPEGLKKLIPKIIETEDSIIDASARGDFAATVLRYPYVYGPHAVAPLEWHVIQRVLDKRKRWIMQSGGLALSPRCASPNAAEFVLRALEKPNISNGQIYNVAESHQFSMREWISTIAAVLDWEFEFVDIPSTIAPLGSTSVPLAGEYSWVREGDVSEGRIRHQLVSNLKASDELGYRDVVDPAKWIETTVLHWIANPPTVDGKDGRLGPKEFDYAAEDNLLRFWDDVLARRPDIAGRHIRDHAYAHPKLSVVE